MRRIAHRRKSPGFTLIEVLVVLAIFAGAVGLVVLSWSGGGQRRLEREGERLATLLETARLHARASGQTVRWRATPDGFVFEAALPHLTAQLPTHWEHADTVVLSAEPIWLGPEPILSAQHITLGTRGAPALQVRVGTDGLAPFQVESTP